MRRPSSPPSPFQAEALVGQEARHRRAEPADPGRHRPAAQHRAPAVEKSQHVDKEDDSEDDRRDQEIAPVAHAHGSLAGSMSSRPSWREEAAWLSAATP